ncbi:aminotransferase class V-fold PLP-dependent enzyme [Salsipaludibacter albus]|uniref:aminotransferase class V-fold PLP-dependent enzyme n=1 Tax=Salsipaludibacter albus TaxID=2849650 RepID=UPI001EE3C74E|nr:aminotransferase class V-fold PLP-dependent enzyme [Salsipaludibacter albus]MBY5162836.1 aminotransferase class V-fold PLP-dependent enzyme [Salsipaludibacter albus]
MFTDDVQRHFTPVPGYCNTATLGLPPRAATTRLRACLDDWEAGRVDSVGFDVDVDRARAAFAQLVGVGADRVAMPGAASISVGTVAASLAPGARVLCAREDFTSVLYPFLAAGTLDVVHVPLEELVDHVTSEVDLVAVSAVQSADGRVLDLDALADAATTHGVRTCVDLTQAAGWLPVDASRFDVTVCSAYKWLCSPRGVGFMTVGADADWLVPHLAGWYASDAPWESCYGPPLRLADDARRFTVSPAWFDVAATAESLDALLDLGVARIHDHDVGLAAALCERLGLPAAGSAIVSLSTTSDPADDLAEAGLVTASRNGRTRVSFHLANTMDDVETAARVLAPHVDATAS